MSVSVLGRVHCWRCGHPCNIPLRNAADAHGLRRAELQAVLVRCCQGARAQGPLQRLCQRNGAQLPLGFQVLPSRLCGPLSSCTATRMLNALPTEKVTYLDCRILPYMKAGAS